MNGIACIGQTRKDLIRIYKLNRMENYVSNPCHHLTVLSLSDFIEYSSKTF